MGSQWIRHDFITNNSNIAEWAVHCMAQVFQGQFNLGINLFYLQPDSKGNKQFPTVHIKALRPCMNGKN